MTRRTKIIITVFIILLSIYITKNFFLRTTITGTYISNDKSGLADGPNFGDTLILYDNGKFISDTWGMGTYELNYTLTGTELKINYSYQFGGAGYETSIYQPLFEKPRIIINKDLGTYFRKID